MQEVRVRQDETIAASNVSGLDRRSRRRCRSIELAQLLQRWGRKRTFAPRKCFVMGRLESWSIDADRSTLQFRLPHVLLGDIEGQFACWGGRVRADTTDLRHATVRIWVELASLSTGSRRRDEEILRTELFDQRWEPALDFDAESVEIDDADRITLPGWLSLRTLRRRFSIAIVSPTIQADPSGALRFVCTARASIDRRALGLHHPNSVRSWLSDQLVGETIEIVAHVEAVQENASSALSQRSAPDRLAPLRIPA
jgi:polyisoprenoid-binding protein YceI